MRVSYDQKSRGLFIHFGDPKKYVESREVAEGLVVDFDADGRPIGIEIEDTEAVVDARAIARLLKPRIRNGSDLRRFREQLDLSQQELGALLEIPRNTIARWERDELPIEKSRLLELALSALLNQPAGQKK